MKKLTLLLTSILLITGCNSNSKDSNDSNLSNTLTNTIINNELDTIIKSPNEDGGLEGNAENDLVAPQDISILKSFLLKVANVSYYTYEINVDVGSTKAHFINHYTPYAWYEESDDPSLSFGYAEEMETGNVFKYYLNEDETEVIPSIYLYTGYNNEMNELKSLYSPLSITHINLLLSNMDDFSAIPIGVNKFIITDLNIGSIFQYMTMYGSSIMNYINTIQLEITSFDNNTFITTIDLGEYGKIVSEFKPVTNSKIKFVNDAIIAGELKGVKYHNDMYDFFKNKISSNNYVLHGIKQPGSSQYPYTIHCTNNYFFLEYDSLNYPGFENYGFAIVPKGKEITYYEKDSYGVEQAITKTLNYTSCYKFKQRDDGSFYFTSLIGPLEKDNITYLEVDNLPATGTKNVIYIVEEEGKKVAYEWRDSSKDYIEYSSSWFNSVGDYPMDNISATFYLSSTPLTTIGPNYYEKDLKEENTYYSDDNGVLSVLANGLFGWGFQSTTTWMDYIKNSKIRVNKDLNNEILSYDICLDVLASYNDEYALHEIYYTVDSFGEGNVTEIEDFLTTTFGGA